MLTRLAGGRLCSGDGNALARLPGIFVANEQGLNLPQQIVRAQRFDQERLRMFFLPVFPCTFRPASSLSMRKSLMTI